MDIDELLADETVNPDPATGMSYPVGVDPESDSWLDEALLSYTVGSAEEGIDRNAGARG